MTCACRRPGEKAGRQPSKPTKKRRLRQKLQKCTCKGCKPIRPPRNFLSRTTSTWPRVFARGPPREPIRSPRTYAALYRHDPTRLIAANGPKSMRLLAIAERAACQFPGRALVPAWPAPARRAPASSLAPKPTQIGSHFRPRAHTHPHPHPHNSPTIKSSLSSAPLCTHQQARSRLPVPNLQNSPGAACSVPLLLGAGSDQRGCRCRSHLQQLLLPRPRRPGSLESLHYRDETDVVMKSPRMKASLRPHSHSYPDHRER